MTDPTFLHKLTDLKASDFFNVFEGQIENDYVSAKFNKKER